MGTGENGQQHKIFQNPIATMAVLDLILEELNKITKNTGTVFQLWHDLWNSIFLTQNEGFSEFSQDCYLMIFDKDEFQAEGDKEDEE